MAKNKCINQPFDENDDVDFLVILIKDEDKKGVFIIPKSQMIHKNILKSKSHHGQMAMRFYPVWETDLNETASKTQKWQTHFFNKIE